MPLLTEVRWFLSGLFLLLAEWATPTSPDGLTVRQHIRAADRRHGGRMCQGDDGQRWQV